MKITYYGHACFGLEDAKITEFQAVVLAQFCRYLVEKGLNYALDQNSFCLRTLCNLVNKFFLRNCCHSLPHSKKEQ